MKTNEHFIFEMTAQAAETFTTYAERHGTLLGCLFESHRLGDHANGRVLVRCKPMDLTNITLPKSPNLIACLCHIWNVEQPTVSIEGLLKKADRIRIDQSKANSNGSKAKTSTKKGS